MGLIILTPLKGLTWTPLSLTPSLWWRGDSLVLESGTRCTQVTDKSGNGNNATASSGSAQRPTYSASLFNGQPGLTFDASTPNYMNWGTNVIFNTGTAVNILHVVKFNGFVGGAQYSLLLAGRAQTNPYQFVQTFYYQTTVYRPFTFGFTDGGATGVMGVTASPALTSFRALTTTYGGSSPSSASSFTMSVDNTTQTVVATGTPWSGAGYINAFGYYTAGTPLGGNFDWCETIVYPPPSGANQTKLATYILNRYGLTI